MSYALLSRDYVLDTDTVSTLFLSNAPTSALEIRFNRTGTHRIWVSVVTIEEALRGALSRIRADETRKAGTSGYELLGRLMRFLLRFQILPFDDEAEGIYRKMTPKVRRVGSGDCKIAASAISRGMIVVTRNARDFDAIGGVVQAD